MEEAKGFEPLNTYVLIVFKTISLNHSDTPPYFKQFYITYWVSCQQNKCCELLKKKLKIFKRYQMISKYNYRIKNLTECQKFSQFLTPWLIPNTFLLLEGELGVGKTLRVRMCGTQRKWKIIKRRAKIRKGSRTERRNWNRKCLRLLTNPPLIMNFETNIKKTFSELKQIRLF